MAKYKLPALNHSSPSSYIGDLMVLVFGKDTLRESSLTGTQSCAHKNVEAKPPLDPNKLEIIIGKLFSSDLLHSLLLIHNILKGFFG